MVQIKQHISASRVIAGAALFGSAALLAESDANEEATYALEEFVITEQQGANIMPVTTYDTPVSNLEFNPRIDFQSRNMSEAQGDVTIRGGIFESTGFRVGSATLIDPQTGHYFAEIPIAPEMLTVPEVLLASENALYGFNTSVGTINYGWTKIQSKGSATVGLGDHDLNFQRIHNAMTGSCENSTSWNWGAELEVSRSESSGTIANGDHDFDRLTGRVQLIGPRSQTDLFAGYQAKFFGWSNMYTPFGVNETENLKTSLFVLNHRQSYANLSFFEITTYYREHKDHYVYSRENPAIFEAMHVTKATALALSGTHAINEQFAINYSGQITGDKIESTSLEQGNFQSRNYTKLGLLPAYNIELDTDKSLTLRAGGTFDHTNRDGSEFSFIGDITWARLYQDGGSDSLYVSYSEASQVVGYTAIGNSETGILFRSNHDLDSETSQNIELGGIMKRDGWSLESAIFYREEDDLVDWTFSNTNTFARSANPVDIETIGIEVIATKQWRDVEAIASYTYLDKNEDYGDATIDDSFYALNYANHRITLGAIWMPNELVKFRIDNEWRSQEKNALRSGDDEALFTHASISLYPPQVEDLEIFFAVDNTWDDGFEEVPGTPGRGDQFSAGATYRW